jgi:hypothetical protein
MTILAEPEAVSHILVLVRDLSVDDRQVLAHLLQNTPAIDLPAQATVDEAVAFYLADACSLGRAAELAGVTRWDIQVYLAARGIPIVAAGDRPAAEIDALADELKQAGIV